MKGLAILLLATILACRHVSQEESFDKTKWGLKDGQDYPYRDRMLNNLIGQYKSGAIRRTELIGLLGEPDRRDSSYLFYTITQERLGEWPLHTKSVVIKLDSTGTVEWLKTHQ